MELSQETVTTAKPLTVSHENIKLYSMLLKCMANNADLQQSLLEAADVINQLTEALKAKE